jgi:hypothetical protein
MRLCTDQLPHDLTIHVSNPNDGQVKVSGASMLEDGTCLSYCRSRWQKSGPSSTDARIEHVTIEQKAPTSVEPAGISTLENLVAVT